MKPLRRQTLVDQTADHLREGFRAGRWTGKLPGVLSLSQALGVSRDTIREAVRQLEKEGVLKATGAGKSRLIVPGRKKGVQHRILRVGLFLHSPLSRENSHSQELLLSIKHGIEDSGHTFVICQKTIENLGNDVSRMARAIDEVQADAWIVYGGTREIFEWFSSMPLPVLAIGGRFRELPVASTSTKINEALEAAVDALVAREHRRIVLVCMRVWRQPTLNMAAESFLQRLRHHGFNSGTSYHLPDWEETAEGLQKLLESLFFATPPTALLLAEPVYAPPTLSFLAGRGLTVPDKVSLITLMPDPMLGMCRPPLAHFEWPISPHVHRAVRWVESIAKGRPDTSASICHATFVPAGTIGKARK